MPSFSFRWTIFPFFSQKIFLVLRRYTNSEVVICAVSGRRFIKSAIMKQSKDGRALYSFLPEKMEQKQQRTRNLQPNTSHTYTHGNIHTHTSKTPRWQFTKRQHIWQTSVGWVFSLSIICQSVKKDNIVFEVWIEKFSRICFLWCANWCCWQKSSYGRSKNRCQTTKWWTHRNFRMLNSIGSNWVKRFNRSLKVFWINLRRSSRKIHLCRSVSQLQT